MKRIETLGTVNDNNILTASVANLAPGQYAIAISIETTALNTPQITFTDVSNHWAKAFIEALAARGIVSGFPDGTFAPDLVVNRAQFAALVSNAFSLDPIRSPIQFTDLPANFWATKAITEAYQTGFLSGYPNQQFRPSVGITKAHALIALINGLKFQSSSTINLADYYQDFSNIPNYTIPQIKIATAKGMVVNYPDLKRFDPNKATTRAEVAAMLYQALMQLGKVPSIASPYIVPPPLPPTVKVSHQREFRGVWVSSVWNLNWPSRRDLTQAQQQQEWIALCDRVADLNLNAIVLQIRAEGDALYPSGLEPWSIWLNGTPGKPPEPYYDPLEFAIAECHKRNLEFHGWINLYRAKSSNQTPANIAPHLEALYPNTTLTYGGQRWLDPGLKIVQDRIYDVILDLVRRYDLDAIHIDDYFYPYPVPNESFPDDASYQAYRDAGGTLSRNDWRRNNIDTIIQRLSQGIRALKPHVKFGVSPFGIYRPGEPPGIKGLDQYDQVFADPKKWLAMGWLDYFAPQLYWPIDQTAQSYTTLLQWWTQNNPKNTHIYVGNNLRKISEPNWTYTEFKRQVEVTRSLANKQALGNIFFSVKVFMDNPENVNAKFKQEIYPKAALVPVIPTLKAPAPPLPTGIRVADNQLRWNAADEDFVRAWTLYQKVGETYQLRQVLPVQITATPITAGTYALCAVNRIGEESEGIVVQW
ncbi:MAG: family 10 glycosylhydrolase [Jaaginema sp. PMC 1079.18]|nr:family 10 glycosylhydrolase [Jaaginema sp. PMC 1080.18]MEC4849964.1 family 10 glycosylhydrolase [Jaaginema sp. PMC 1079.18]MEC4866941.1 family 10 glycosylhydrolase [Jaaginema sp. PMC 1078.18]